MACRIALILAFTVNHVIPGHYSSSQRRHLGKIMKNSTPHTPIRHLSHSSLSTCLHHTPLLPFEWQARRLVILCRLSESGRRDAAAGRFVPRFALEHHALSGACISRTPEPCQPEARCCFRPCKLETSTASKWCKKQPSLLRNRASSASSAHVPQTCNMSSRSPSLLQAVHARMSKPNLPDFDKDHRQLFDPDWTS